MPAPTPTLTSFAGAIVRVAQRLGRGGLLSPSLIRLVQRFHQQPGLATWTVAEWEKFCSKLTATEQPDKDQSNFVVQLITELSPLQREIALPKFELALRKQNCSNATIRNYRSDINQFLDFCKTNDSVAALSKAQISDFERYQAQKGLQPSSIRRKTSSITHFSSWLVKEQPSLAGKTTPAAATAAVPSAPVAAPVSMPVSAPAAAQPAPVIETASPSTPKTESVSTPAPAVKPPIALPAIDLAKLFRKKASNSQKNGSSTTEPVQPSISPIAPHFKRWQQSLTWLSFLNLAAMVLFFVGLGVLGYQQLFRDTSAPLAFPSTPVTPGRFLSFQGRLTDTAGNPITSATNLAFRLYSASSGGSLLWDSSTCSITPDQDGIFSTLLGSSCGAAIGSEVFSENANVWLEVQVAAETLTPRQQIASVGYALNSDTLRGYPLSATGAATVNSILFMDGGGSVVLGETNPEIRSLSGTFTLEGQSLTFQTGSGSNGNIVLDANGLGGVISRDYVHAPGATLSATYAGGVPLTVQGGPSGTAHILDINNSSAGNLAYFANTGELVVSQGVSYTSTLQANTLAFSRNAENYVSATDASGQLIFRTGGNNNRLTISSAGNFNFATGTTAFNGLTYTWPGSQSAGYILSTNGSGALSWVDPALAGSASIFWSQSNGALYPKNSTVDVLIGGQSSDSADFAFLNVNSGTPTASFSGNLTLNSAGVIATTLNQSLQINPLGGRVGIGTSAPSAAFNLGVNAGSFALGDGTNVSAFMNVQSNRTMVGYDGSNATLQGGTNKGIRFNVNSSSFGAGNVMAIDTSGNVSIGTTTALATLDVRRVSGTAAVASFSGATSFATLVADNSGVGDIFTASSSGLNRFVITQTGRVGIGTTRPTALFQVLDTGVSNNIPEFSVSDGVYSFNLGYDSRSLGSNRLSIYRNSSNTYFENSAGTFVFSVDGTNFNTEVRSNGISVGPSLSWGTVGALDLRRIIGTEPVATISGATSFASLVVDNSGVGDIFTASSSGLNRFVITQNGYVGIGTTSPSEKLSIYNANDSQIHFANSTTGSTSSDGTLIGLDTGENIFTFTNQESGSGAFRWLGGGSELMRLLTNGNLGIGTTNPTANLHIFDSAIDLLKVERSGNANSHIEFINGQGSYFSGIDGSGNYGLGLNTDLSSSPSLYILRASGNIGMGTTTPNANLDIRGGSVTFGFEGNSGQQIISGANASTNNGNLYVLSSTVGGIADQGGSIVLGGRYSNAHSDVAGFGKLVGGQENSVSGNYAGYLGFFTRAHSGNMIEQMRLSSGGDLQLNAQNNLRLADADSSAYAALQSPATLGASYTLTLPDDDGASGQALVTDGNGLLSWSTVATLSNVLWFQNNGALYPANSTVDFLIGGQSTASARFAVTNVNGGATTATISGTTAGYALSVNGDGTIATSLNRSLFLNPNGGNVAIGTTSPATGAKLDVNGNLRLPSNGILGFGVTSDTGLAGPTIYFGTTTSSAGQVALGLNGGSGNGANSGLFFPNRDTIAFSASGTELMRIGNGYGIRTVGIGTTSPLSTFDVRRQSGTLSVASFSGATSFATLVADNSGVGDIFTASSSGLNRFVITQNGRVGIGTTTPGELLSLDSALYDPAISIQSRVSPGAATNNFLKVYNGVGGERVRFSYDQSGVVFGIAVGGTVTTPHLAIEGQQGFVGLGTTAPLARLDVSGNASISGNLTFNAASSIQNTQNRTLTIGGDSTGNIILNPLNGSGRVGINTTTPGSNLHVVGTAGNSIVTTSTGGNLRLAQAVGTTRTGLHFQNFTVSHAGISSDGRDIYMGNASNSVDPDSWVSTTFALKANSNLGLGTSDPIAKFQVTGAPGAGGNALAIFNQTGSSDILAASASGANRMVLTNAGYLGLGTTAPDNRLQVHGLMASYLSGGLGLYNNANSYYTSSDLAYIYESNGSGGSYPFTTAGNLIVQSRTSGGATDIVFATGNGTPTAKAFISGTGDFQINLQGDLRLADADSSAYAALQSPATLGASYTLTLPDDDGASGQALVTDGNGLLSWSTVATLSNVLWFQNNGALYPANSTVDFLIGGQSTASARFAVTNVNSGAVTATISGATAGHALSLSGNGTIATSLNRSLFLNPDGGNVAIGTSTPSTSRLTVYSAGTNNSGINIAGNLSQTGAISVTGTQVWGGGASAVSFTPTFNAGGVNSNSVVSISPTMGASTTGSIYGINISPVTLGGNTVTTQYGLYLGNITGATNNYAIYSTGGTNYFGGNVGIGTTSPTALLDIAGSASTSGTLAFRGTTDPKIDVLNGEAFGIRTSPGGDTGLTERFTILANGQVGVGTTNPVTEFQVHSTDAVSYIHITDSTTGASSNDGFTIGYNNGAVVYNRENSPLTLATNALSRMTITGSGLVGIGASGVTSPTGTLDVRAMSGTLPIATISGSTSFAALVADNSGVGDIFTASSSGLNRFVIAQNGNVGIGTTIPGTSLHISAGNAITGTSAGTSSPAQSNLAIMTNTAYGQDIGGIIGLGGMYNATTPSLFGAIRGGKENGTVSNNAGYLGFFTTQNGIAIAERMRISSTGLVGIGTTVPSQALHVVGNAYFDTSAGELTIQNTGSGSVELVGTGSVILDAATATSVAFQVGDTTLGTFFNNNFGVGDTSPASMLTVGNGDLFQVNSSGNIVSLGGVAHAIGNSSGNLNLTSNSTQINLNDDAFLTAQSDLRLADADSSAYAALQSPATLGASYTLTLPDDDGASGQALVTDGNGLLSWSTVATLSNVLWFQNNGALYPANSTVDFLIGGQSTASARFAVTNVNGGATTATISGTTAGYALSMNGDGTIATSLNRSLLLNPNGGRVGIGTTSPDFDFAVGGITTTARIGAAETGAWPTNTDYAYFGNQALVHSAAGNYALLQSNAGVTYLNAASGQSIFFGINNGYAGRVFSNGNWGIGPNWDTNTALATLDVAGSASISGTLAFRGTTDPKIDILNGEAFGIRTSPGGDAGLTERLTVLNNGNVGIGTTTPGAKLDLYQSDNGPLSARLINSGTGTASRSYVLLGESTSSGNYGMLAHFNNSFTTSSYLQANSTLLVGPDSNGLNIVAGGEDNPSATMKFWTNSIERMSLDSSGNFQVNTQGDLRLADADSSAYSAIQSPATLGASYTLTLPTTDGDSGQVLSTDGSGVLSWTGVATLSNIFWYQGNGALYPANSTVDFLIGGQSTASARFAVTNVNSGATTATISGTTAGYALSMNGDGTIATSLNRSLLLNPNGGNVGIGTTNSDTYKLLVWGNTSASTFIGGNNGSASSVVFGVAGDTDTGMFGRTTNELNFSTNGTERIRIKDNGNITFGSAADTIFKYLFTGAPAADGNALTVFNQAGSGDILSASASGTNRLTLSNAGALGIGTTTPGYYLQVGSFVSPFTSAGINMVGIQKNNADTAYPMLSIINGGSGDASMLFNVSGSTFTLGIDQSDSAKFKISRATDLATTNVLTIDSSSRVGINTTNPTANLDIAGVASTSGTLTFRGSTDPKIDILNGEAFGIRTSPGGDAGLTERLTVLNNGNVGIGSTTPSQALQVVGNITNNGFVNAGTDFRIGGAQIVDFSSTTARFAAHGSWTDVALMTSGVDRLHIDTIGNVGIGTTVPTADLHIVGNYAANSALIVNQTNGYNILSASASGTTRLVLTNAGDLGLGTTTPGGKIHAIGTGGATQVAVFQGGAGQSGDVLQVLSDGGSLEYLSVNPDSGTVFNESGIPAQDFRIESDDQTHLLFVDAGNNVLGIGTSAPTNALELGFGNFQINNLGDIRLADSGSSNYAAIQAPTDITSNYTLTLPDNDGDANQVLQTDGSGVLSWTTPSVGSASYWNQSNGVIYPYNSTVDLVVGGQSTASARFALTNINAGAVTASMSGTAAGSALSLNGDGTIATSLNRSLLLNPTGGNVGIGTTTPTSLLQIAGDFAFDAADRHILRDTVQRQSFYAASTVFNETGADIDFRIEGDTNVNTFYLDASANRVGIGTSNPQAQLHVGPGDDGHVRIDGGTIDVRWDFVSRVYLSQNLGVDTGLGYNSGGIRISGQAVGEYGYILGGRTASGGTGSDILFNPNNAGNIGIGTYVPTARLSITGNGTTTGGAFNVTNSSGTSGFYVQDQGNVGIGTTTPVADLHIVGNYGSNAAVIVDQLNSGDIIAASVSGATRFRVDTNGYTHSQRFSDLANSAYFLDPAATSTSLAVAGDIGINTTAPSARIHAISTTEQLRLGYDVSNYTQFTTGATGDITIVPSGGDLTLTGNLNVSGTTTFNSLAYTWPASQTAGHILQTNGSGTLSWADPQTALGAYWRQYLGALSPINNTLDVLIGGLATDSANFAFINNVSGGNPTASISGDLAFNSSGNIRTTINRPLTLGGATTGNIILNPLNGVGRIGINTTAPIYNIHLLPSSGDPTFAMGDADVAHGVTGQATTTTIFHVAPISSTAGGAQLTGFADQVAGAQALELRGITGSTGPNTGVPMVRITGALRSGTGVADLAANDTIFDVRNNDNAAAFTILGNNYVGIGTTAPAYSLHVENSAARATMMFRTFAAGDPYAEFQLSNYDGGQANILFTHNDGASELGNLWQLTSADDTDTFNIHNWTLDAPLMRFDNASNRVLFGNNTSNFLGLLHLETRGTNVPAFGKAVLSINQIETNGDLFTASASGTTRFVITNAGGFGLNTPSANLLGAVDVRGHSSSLPIATFSGSTSGIGLRVENNGSGEVFRAGVNGRHVMSVRSNGSVAIGTTQGGTTRLWVTSEGGTPFGATGTSVGSHLLGNFEVMSAWSTNDTGTANEYFMLFRSDEDGTPDNEYRIETNGQAYADGAWNGGGADVAEMYKVLGNAEEGDLVAITSGQIDQPGKTLAKSNGSGYDSTVVGVISTNPGLVAGWGDTEGGEVHDTQPVALVGRVPVKVSLENGPIAIGDPLTSANQPGVAMKATRAGRIIGYALEAYDGSQPLSAGTIAVEQERLASSSDRQPLPAPQAGTGKIMVFVNTSYHDPAIRITSTGDVVINGDDNAPIATATYTATAGSTLLEKVDAFAELAVANLKAGVIRTRQLLAEVRIQSPEVQTNLISPIDDTVAVQLNDTNDQFQIVNGQDQVVASIDDQGNTQLGALLADSATITGDASISGDATISGELDATSARISTLESKLAELDQVRAQTAEIVNATISGTLYATTIDGFEDKIASALEQPSLLSKLLDQQSEATESASVASVFNIIDQAGYTATGAASLNVSLEDLNLSSDEVAIGASAAFINKYFEVNGSGYIADKLGVGNEIWVGEGMRVSDGSLSYQPAGNTAPVLNIQPQGLGSINLLAGAMVINANGKVEISGDLQVAGDVAVEGSLLSDLIKPTDFTNPLQVQVAGVSTESGQVKESRFEIVDELGAPVATISAAGRASFAGGLAVGSQDLSGTQSQAETTKTSGKAIVKQGETEMVIKSELITSQTVVQITPQGSTNNQVLYVKGVTAEDPNTTDKEGQFVVGFDTAIPDKDVLFTWWILN